MVEIGHFHQQLVSRKTDRVKGQDSLDDPTCDSGQESKPVDELSPAPEGLGSYKEIKGRFGTNVENSKVLDQLRVLMVPVLLLPVEMSVPVPEFLLDRVPGLGILLDKKLPFYGLKGTV